MCLSDNAQSDHSFCSRITDGHKVAAHAIPGHAVWFQIGSAMRTTQHMHAAAHRLLGRALSLLTCPDLGTYVYLLFLALNSDKWVCSWCFLEVDDLQYLALHDSCATNGCQH